MAALAASILGGNKNPRKTYISIRIKYVYIHIVATLLEVTSVVVYS